MLFYLNQSGRLYICTVLPQHGCTSSGPPWVLKNNVISHPVPQFCLWDLLSETLYWPQKQFWIVPMLWVHKFKGWFTASCRSSWTCSLFTLDFILYHCLLWSLFDVSRNPQLLISIIRFAFCLLLGSNGYRNIET